VKRTAAVLLVASLLGASCGLAPGGGPEPLVIFFEDVGDLVERSTVQVSDVEIGTVDEIALVMQNGQMLARVSISVSPDQRIPAGGLQAVVRQTSLLGEQFIELRPASEGPPFVGEQQVTVPVERTDRRVDVETFLADLSGLVGSGGLEDLNRFTHAQALILQERGRRFGKTLEELEKFTSVLADRSVDIGAAIESLNSASKTIVANRATLDNFLDSLDEANALLAEQGDELGALFRGLSRFGAVNARFLAQHEDAIDRQFKALLPILQGLAGAEKELRVDLAQLRQFFLLFPLSLGGGPGDKGEGDYIQADAVLCEVLAACHTKGEKGDVPGEGSS
jgi:phospholipid/cholesterol/gamma-HCH transport system substrate-binding protein